MRLIPGRHNGRATLSLFCLAPRGVCHAAVVAFGAVGSYPTLSPLPVTLRSIGGLLSAALSVRVPRGSRPPFSRGTLLYGVRTFLNHRLRGNCDRPGSGGKKLARERYRFQGKSSHLAGNSI
jgi:hypothetical protein